MHSEAPPCSKPAALDRVRNLTPHHCCCPCMQHTASIGLSPLRRPHRLSGCGGDEPPTTPLSNIPLQLGVDALSPRTQPQPAGGLPGGPSDQPSTPSTSSPSAHHNTNHHLPSYLASGPVPHASLRSISPLRSGALAAASEGAPLSSRHDSPTRHAPSHLSQASTPTPMRPHLTAHFTDLDYILGLASSTPPQGLGSPMHTLGRASPALASPSGGVPQSPVSTGSLSVSPTRLRLPPGTTPSTVPPASLSPTRPPRLGAGGAAVHLGARGGPGVVSSSSGALTLLPTCGSPGPGVGSQLESPSHRPPTPMGGEEQVAHVSRHFSTRHRVSR